MPLPASLLFKLLATNITSEGLLSGMTTDMFLHYMTVIGPVVTVVLDMWTFIKTLLILFKRWASSARLLFHMTITSLFQSELGWLFFV